MKVKVYIKQPGGLCSYHKKNGRNLSHHYMKRQIDTSLKAKENYCQNPLNS